MPVSFMRPPPPERQVGMVKRVRTNSKKIVWKVLLPATMFIIVDVKAVNPYGVGEVCDRIVKSFI